MTYARGRVFLSYRRDDTKHIAGRLADRLTLRIGSDHVFMDVDTIEPGVDFRVALVQAVESCDVLIALIGPKWVADLERGHRRNDYVLLELGTALNRGIRVVPVLADGATMPAEEALPLAIQGLTRRNAVRLDHETFQSDVERLLTAVEKALQSSPAATGAATTRIQKTYPSGVTPKRAPVPPLRSPVGIPAPRLPEAAWRAQRPPYPLTTPSKRQTQQRHSAAAFLVLLAVGLTVMAVIAIELSSRGGATTTPPTFHTLPASTTTAYAPTTLGIQIQTLVGTNGLGTGAQVVKVVPGSPAAQVGLQPGDIITALDGKPTLTADALTWAVQAHSRGDVAAIRFARASIFRELVVIF